MNLGENVNVNDKGDIGWNEMITLSCNVTKIGMIILFDLIHVFGVIKLCWHQRRKKKFNKDTIPNFTYEKNLN